MNKHNSVIVSLVLASLTMLFASPAADAQGVNASFDFATFRYDSSNTYMELHYSFNMRTLRLVKVDSAFADTVVFHLSMRQSAGDSAGQYQAWAVPVEVRDTTPAELNRSLVGQVGLAVKTGNYSMFVATVDRNDTSKIDSIAETVEVPRYSFRTLQTSDVELCAQITQADSGQRGLFYKNTYNVVPNPKGVYGAGLPIIYYYLEAYNIPDATGDSLFTAEYQIRDSFGQVRKSRQITKRKFGDTSVEVGTVNGSDLRTGTYTFIYTIVDSVANTYATSSRRFFIYNPGLGAPESAGGSLAGMSVLSSVFATMDDEQITREFNQARYIATSTEMDQFDELQSLPAKRQFLYDFWKKRSPNPVLNTNPFRAEYLQRVAYADDHFRIGSTPGWRTDRGRVYLVYGNPDQIDRHPNEENSKPYEIWYYNAIQGGVSFDFVDKTGFGDYALVNSTARNEIHNDNWQQYLGAN
jgi:GWxTD domain-containing protein